MTEVSSLGPLVLFIGVKWDGHDWIQLPTGYSIPRNNTEWCTGSPQGKVGSIAP